MSFFEIMQKCQVLEDVLEETKLVVKYLKDNGEVCMRVLLIHILN